MLNLSGIIFSIQFVTLLFVGAYADYGVWRPWVMIGEPAMTTERYSSGLTLLRLYGTLVLLSIFYLCAEQTWSMDRCSGMLRRRCLRYVSILNALRTVPCGDASADDLRSHEHGHCLLRCYVPWTCSGSARGHQVRTGCHRWCR